MTPGDVLEYLARPSSLSNFFEADEKSTGAGQIDSIHLPVVAGLVALVDSIPADRFLSTAGERAEFLAAMAHVKSALELWRGGHRHYLQNAPQARGRPHPLKIVQRYLERCAANAAAQETKAKEAAGVLVEHSREGGLDERLEDEARQGALVNNSDFFIAKLEGIIKVLRGLDVGATAPAYPAEFSAQRMLISNVIEARFGANHRFMRDLEQAGRVTASGGMATIIKSLQSSINNHVAIAEAVRDAISLQVAGRWSLGEEGVVTNVARVFVVHGRNGAVRDSLFGLLRCWRVQPMEWSEAVRLTNNGSPYVGEVLDAAFANAQAVVVLLTGDDLAHLRAELVQGDDPPYERDPTPQARPNVLFEAGLALARHPTRTILVQVGELRPFSDVAGRHVVRLKDDVGSRQALGIRLRDAGCPVYLDGIDWHRIGSFV